MPSRGLHKPELIQHETSTILYDDTCSGVQGMTTKQDHSTTSEQAPEQTVAGIKEGWSARLLACHMVQIPIYLLPICGNLLLLVLFNYPTTQTHQLPLRFYPHQTYLPGIKLILLFCYGDELHSVCALRFYYSIKLVLWRYFASL